MRTYKLLISFSLFIFSFSLCEGQNWVWAREAATSGTGTHRGEGDPLSGQSATTDGEGNVYLTGLKGNEISFGSDTLNGSNYSLFLAKYDANGNVLWATQPTFSNSGGEPYAVATDKYGNVYLTGNLTHSICFGSDTLTSGANFNIFLVKYNSNGNVIWAKQANPSISGFGTAYSVAVDAVGSPYITGSFKDTLTLGSFTLKTQAYNDVFTAKYDTNGNVLWAEQGDVPSNSSSGKGASAAIDKDGNCYITGSFTDTLSLGVFTISTNDFYNSVFLAKYNANGTILWVKHGVLAGSNSSGTGTEVAIDGLGNPYITGNFIDTIVFGSHILESPLNQNDAFLVKYDSNGNVIWAKQGIGLDGNNWTGFSLSCDTLKQGGGFLDIGLTSNSGTPPFKVKFNADTFSLNTTPPYFSASILLHFDSTGNVLCGTIFSEGYEDDVDAITVDHSGKYIYLGGDIFDTAIFGTDTLTYGGDMPFIARWQDCKNIGESINEIKTTNENVSVYPNPFFNTTTIMVNTSGKRSLELDDLTGRKLKYIEFTGNTYTLSVEGLAKGLYFVRVYDNENNVIGTTKIVVQ